ncbi:hypothetical protein HMPREF9997_01077 [Corynebacterium durum F0235]|uniref:Uncharacterized protein n=1 Tax=Corynebacterium durum F0235 TaxID=1035195 RepID=L1MH62_9CORY|nr:hypothetical protein HMPREF9997_01077 [Corynebacterium durum F0235]
MWIETTLRGDFKQKLTISITVNQLFTLLVAQVDEKAHATLSELWNQVLISRAKSAWLLAEGNTFGAYLLPSFLARCQMRRQHGGVPFWLVEVSLNRDVPAL